MKKSFIFLTVLIASSLQVIKGENQCETYKYEVAATPWNEEFGNHRAVLEVEGPSQAVDLEFYWRRPDKDVSNKQFLIVDAANGDTIQNILRHKVDNEVCNITFGPVNHSGQYYFYYLSYEPQMGGGAYYLDYKKQESEPNIDWVQDYKNMGEVPSAKVKNVESRSKFDSFYPMEIAATASEIEQYCKKQNGNRKFYLFPEDRTNPIRMRHLLPENWMHISQGTGFEGNASPNEYYTFQVGVWSPDNDIEGVKYNISDLSNGESKITADRITCFNLEGTRPSGENFNIDLNVAQGEIQPLWFGVDIPKEIKAGSYRGMLSICDKDGHDYEIPVDINIEGPSIADRGDSEPWRHSRLRWLNSTLGIEDTPISPYRPMDLRDENIIEFLGRNITIDTSTSLPAQINSWGKDILSSPIRFVIETDKGIKRITGKYNVDSTTDGHISFNWKGEDKDLSIKVKGICEFDGWSNYVYTITPKHDINVKDIRLELNLRNDVAQQFLGAGLPGQDLPESYSGKWDTPEKTVNNFGVSIPVNKKQNWLWPFDSFWIGSVKAGLHCELRGASYTGPLLNAYRPEYPDSWHNQGKGGFSLLKGKKNTLMTVYSGERELKAGEPIDFDFALIVTPVKQIDLKSQFSNRYYHNGSKPTPTAEDVEAGVRIINIHHANEYNPFINYPFLTTNKLKNFINEWHSKGCKVKTYYTLRELTNATTEIWAIRSLGTEILRGGAGGGFPWLREHFVDGYTPQWYQHFDHNDDTGILADAAILTTESDSRWYNYYIEGLRWMVENLDIDGLYLDDVSFGRDILKRMRRAMESVKPGCIIDLHSNTGFSRGPANQYAEFFPYIDKLWLGESFMYDSMSPANWLVESSGIPFGLTGDMLHRGGNKWLGMQYGMTVRHPWFTEGVICDPRPIWKIWDEFNIADSKMIGFWEEDNPVKVSDSDVKTTVYVHEGKALLSLGNYSDTQKQIILTVDNKKLGINNSNVKFIQPEISDFQEAKEYGQNEVIDIEPRKGLLLYLE